MRIDKYLKVSRLIKRRTVACEACETGKVKINGKIAKPGTDVKENDIIEITFVVQTFIVKCLMFSARSHNNVTVIGVRTANHQNLFTVKRTRFSANFIL